MWCWGSKQGEMHARQMAYLFFENPLFENPLNPHQKTPVVLLWLSHSSPPLTSSERILHLFPPLLGPEISPMAWMGLREGSQQL